MLTSGTQKSSDSSARNVLGVEVPAADWIAEDGIAEAEITERLQQLSDRYMAEKAVRFGAANHADG